ncbi:MAG TPA: isochorismatase family protein [Methylomirabilota bacterium]|nr:isochorismatase family protein [Methylomirabilota bacterium]
MDKRALVVIDAQQEYFAPLGKLVLPHGPAAIKRVGRALDWARGSRVSVVHVVHESVKASPTTFAPGSKALELHPDARAAVGEAVFTKHLPGAFTGTGLEALLRDRSIDHVLLAGFMTQMCVDTTARQAAHLGFRVTVLSDATAAMAVTAPDGAVIDADQVHRTHLGSLSGFLATIQTVDEATRA